MDMRVAPALKLLLLSSALVVLACAASHAQAQGWQEEFDYVCSHTQDSARMGSEELRSLAERCDRLMPEIERLEEPRRKPLMRRLKMSRDFYRFMLEQKRQEGGR